MDWRSPHFTNFTYEKKTFRYNRTTNETLLNRLSLQNPEVLMRGVLHSRNLPEASSTRPLRDITHTASQVHK